MIEHGFPWVGMGGLEAGGGCPLDGEARFVGGEVGGKPVNVAGLWFDRGDVGISENVGGEVGAQVICSGTAEPLRSVVREHRDSPGSAFSGGGPHGHRCVDGGCEEALGHSCGTEHATVSEHVVDDNTFVGQDPHP